MIHKLTANQASFHSVEFEPGFNVILAERTKEASGRDTRNGIGKSTLIAILDFCLGSRAQRNRDRIMSIPNEWAFTLELTVGPHRVLATRSLETPSRIAVEGETTHWPIQPELGEDGGQRTLRIEDWKLILGVEMFGLARSYEVKYRPRVRSLLSFVVRQSNDAYSDPFRHYRQQKTWDIQLHNAFLLDLNWEHAGRRQVIRDKDQAAIALGKAADSGLLEGMTGSAGELEAEAVGLEARLQRQHTELSSFRVLEEYRSIQEEADELTHEMRALANQNSTDRRTAKMYEDSLEQERAPEERHLESLYEEAGVLFPDAVTASLDQAQEFHRRIVENRREFLRVEIGRLRSEVSLRDGQLTNLESRRSSILETLRTHGALDEYAMLQERSAETAESLKKTRSRISDIRSLSSKKRELRVEAAELARVTEDDYQERRPIWARAVRTFNENSQALYRTPGVLAIDVADTGYQFSVDIPRGASEGIGKMKIFCYDLMLAQLWAQRDSSPGFWIHDSLIFDGVDSRQRALALERARERTESCDFQYICTLNSDMVPREDFSDGFEFDDFVRLTLTDRDQSGSLLGIRF